MKIYTVGFSPVYPVGCCLVINANNIEEAEKIAKETITHTDEFTVVEEDISEPGVIEFLDGDY